MPAAIATRKSAPGAPAPLVRSPASSSVRQGRARGQASRDIDGDAVMLERQRLDDARFVGGEVVVGDRRSAGLQVGRDVARQATLVIFARTAVGEPAHRLAEIAE